MSRRLVTLVASVGLVLQVLSMRLRAQQWPQHWA